jgi:hypothetical protein
MGLPCHLMVTPIFTLRVISGKLDKKLIQKARNRLCMAFGYGIRVL